MVLGSCLSYKMSWGSYCCGGAAGGGLGKTNNLGEVGPHRISKVIMLARQMENWDLVSFCVGLAGWKESSTKEQWCLPVLQCLERVSLTSATPTLTLKLISLVSFCKHLTLFELLPLQWNLEQVNLCIHPLRSLCLILSQPLSLWDAILDGFQSQMLWELLFLETVPRLGSPYIPTISIFFNRSYYTWRRLGFNPSWLLSSSSRLQRYYSTPLSSSWHGCVPIFFSWTSGLSYT